MGGKWSEERRSKFKATMAARKTGTLIKFDDPHLEPIKRTTADVVMIVEGDRLVKYRIVTKTFDVLERVAE